MLLQSNPASSSNSQQNLQDNALLLLLCYDFSHYFGRRIEQQHVLMHHHSFFLQLSISAWWRRSTSQKYATFSCTKPKVMMNAAADVPVLRDISSPFFVSQTLLLISLVERLVETCEFWRFSGPIDITYRWWTKNGYHLSLPLLLCNQSLAFLRGSRHRNREVEKPQWTFCWQKGESEILSPFSFFSGGFLAIVLQRKLLWK